MSRKILCPYHVEQTPSMVMYPDTGIYHCFGCSATGQMKNLPDSALTELEVEDFMPRPKEDVEERIRYIKTLPKKVIRGVPVHYDAKSFYLLWPDSSYYLRRFTDGSEPKYKGPLGVDRPLYQPSLSRGNIVVLIEGELNAYSLAQVHDGNVISVGGTGNFTVSRLSRYLKEFKKYDRVVLMLDDDPAGMKAAMTATGYLKGIGKEVNICLMEKDANWVLTNEGAERLRNILEGCLNSRVEEGAERGPMC